MGSVGLRVGSGRFWEILGRFLVVPGKFRRVPGRFRVVPGRFRVVQAGSGRFRVGSAFYIHPHPRAYITNAI